MKKRILIVEDSPSLAAVYESYLENGDFSVATVETGKDAMVRLIQSPPDVVLLDIKLPDMNGMDILRYIHENSLPSEAIIITAHGSIDMAVDAMQSGAFDFLVKPFDAKRLTVTVSNALEHQSLAREVATYRESFSRHNYEGFIGESLPMQAVYRIIDSAAPSNATVFITGESGTGKEVCANAIHSRSPRKKGPFIAINCGAIPKDLMESEIFGHVKGAFTGAQNARDGAATLADGGTLFLDEICEMDLDLQTKLLRFIQTGTYQKVGGSQQESVDVRFLCATNKDPFTEVCEGRFREDLYYRLHVIPLSLPPLRERETDVKLLMDELLIKYAEEEGKAFRKFSPTATSIMMEYDWPGNVRQLQNVVRNIVVLNNGEQVDAEMIPPPVCTSKKITPNKAQGAIQSASSVVAEGANIGSEASNHNGASSTNIRPLWIVEKEAIEHAIDFCDGNIPKAAALLDVSASTIYRKREKWD